MTIATSGADDFAKRMADMAAKLRDPKAAYEQFVQYVDGRTTANFGSSRNWDGSPMEPLKPETIAKRIGERGGNRTNKRSGKLTKRAERVRATVSAFGARPLLDTGKMLRSFKYRIHKRGVKVRALGILGIHIIGTSRIPVRNPTPFLRARGRWILANDARAKLLQLRRAQILAGGSA